MSDPHIPAITRYRDDRGFREGWDRHEERWIPLTPPPVKAPRAVQILWAEVRDAELARLDPPVRPRAQKTQIERAYNSGYKAGYRAALRKHGIVEG